MYFTSLICYCFYFSQAESLLNYKRAGSECILNNKSFWFAEIWTMIKKIYKTLHVYKKYIIKTIYSKIKQNNKIKALSTWMSRKKKTNRNAKPVIPAGFRCTPGCTWLQQKWYLGRNISQQPHQTPAPMNERSCSTSLQLYVTITKINSQHVLWYEKNLIWRGWQVLVHYIYSTYT